MTEFWDKKFKEEKTMWGFEPSDATILAKDFFLKNDIKDILIPGIGYGRNAKIFLDSGIKVTGIEISRSAIELANKENALDINIYHGSVTEMPFDNNLYDGIYCYALIHLLNKQEREEFIQNCFNQLKLNGYMIFIVVSKKDNMFGKGRQIGKDRFELMKGLEVFFYDSDSVNQEFGNYGLIDFHEIDEPIKFMENEPHLKLIYVICRKNGL